MKVFLLFVIHLPLLLLSQIESVNWTFGKNAGLNFSSPNPQILSGTAMNLWAASQPACISDDNANLLFYFHLDTIWNSQHQVMANGTGLFANVGGPTTKLILKRPGSNQIYYLFYLSYNAPQGLYYSIIDMGLAAGLGSVTAKNAPINIGGFLTTITGAKHCNGQDNWIVMHEQNNNVFRSFLLNAAGINTIAVISAAGPTFSYTTSSMKINPQGTRLGLLNTTPPTSVTANFFDFDRSNGQVSNFFLGNNFGGLASTGCEFSSDGSKFYFTELALPQRIHQLNLCAGSAAAIAASDFTVPGGGHGLSRASNGKIYYIRVGTNYLGVIHNPNVSGLTMNLVHQGLDMSPHLPGQYLPYFINAQTKEQFQYKQGLGCFSTQFYPPTISNVSIAACWSSGNTVSGLHWNFGDPSSGALNTSTLSSPTHNFNAFGTYTVKLAMSYSNCAADTVQQVISIVQASANVLTSSVACNGLTSASLTVWGGSGNYSFTWMPGAINGSVATALPNGIYTIQVNDNTFNCQQSFTTNVQSPIVNISAVIQSTPYCNFSNASVTVNNGSGNFTYLWQPGNFTVVSASNLIAGLYTVNVNDQINNCSFNQTIQITPLALPVLTVSPNATICAGQSKTLSVSGADTYLWSNGSTNQSIMVSPGTTSYYSVSGTLIATGCSVGKTVTITVLPCPGFFEESSDGMDIRVFPNPFPGLLSIQLLKEEVVKVFSLLGIEVLSKKLMKGISELDMRELEDGLYFLRIDGRERTGIKLIKTRP